MGVVWLQMPVRFVHNFVNISVNGSGAKIENTRETLTAECSALARKERRGKRKSPSR
jgi:hypothetical protein